MQSIFEPLLDALVMNGEVTIQADEDFSLGSLRVQFHRYKKRMKDLPAMSEMLQRKTLVVTEDKEAGTITLSLKKKPMPYKIVKQENPNE